VRKVKIISGPWYAGLREVAVFRQRLKMSAVVLPPILDRIADEYGLPS
jgi:hypothetical protein